MLNKLLIGTFTASVFAGPAFAADLVLKARPAPAPPVSWSGFYAGMNIGGVWSKSSTTTTAVPTFTDPFLLPSSAPFAATAVQGATGETSIGSRSGLIGGAQFGYNVQFKSVVAGFEADLQGTANNRATSIAVSTLALPPVFVASNLITTITASRSLDYLGTVRGRFGVVVAPSLLLYATGGLAYGEPKSSTSIANLRDAFPNSPSSGFSSGAFSGTRVGYTLGGGAEWMLREHWSLKAEYLYYDLGTVNYALSPLSNNFFGALYTSVAPTASTRFNGNIARVGINYHF